MTVPSTKRGSVGLDEVVYIATGPGPVLGEPHQPPASGDARPATSCPADRRRPFLPRSTRPPTDLHMEPDYRAGTTGASKELGRTGYYFMLAFSLTFIFMYIVLAAQFESFIHPITILLTLAAGDALRHSFAAGHAARPSTSSPASACCCCSASSRRTRFCRSTTPTACAEQGMPRYEAIIQANRDRLRPILMTTIALVAGMLPLVVSSGTGSATNRSIGVLVAGGQSLCLLLTLLAVPVFYSLFEDLQESPVFRRIGNAIGGLKRFLPARKPREIPAMTRSIESADPGDAA